MKPTQHSDQNPEEAPMHNQEENSQLENAVSTIEEETTVSIENTIVAEEVSPEPIAEVISTGDEPVESVHQAIQEPVTEPEVTAADSEPVEVAQSEIVTEPDTSAEPEVSTTPTPLSEVLPVLTTENAELLDEVIEAEMAAAESIDLDYSHMDREQLVNMLEQLVQNEDVNEIKAKITQIKVAYLALSNKERQEMYQNAAANEEAENFEVTDPLEDRFKIAFGIYKHNKFRYTEDQEKVKLVNLEAKKKILDELRVLINSEETLKKTYDEFKALKEQWKGIGMVSKTEARE